MALNFRTGFEILRLYGPMWRLLALYALTSAAQALAAFSFTPAHGEKT